MTAGALTFDKALSPRRIRWASVGQFLVTGGATLLLIPLAVWYQRIAGLERSEYIVSYAAFYAAYVINDPHFAVSYFLFYKNAGQRLRGEQFQGAQRVRYWVAGFVVPVALVSLIAFALIEQSAAVLGGMIQLMFFLVGWHYVKQGFGVLTVLSARKGVRFSALERYVFLTHCVSGWAYAWSNPREVGGTYQESGVVYHALAHPPGLEQVTGFIFAASTVLLVVAFAIRVKKGLALPPLAGTCGLLMSVWLWTVYSNFDPLMVYVIPGLHSLQYWYFVYLLKKNQTASDLGPENRAALPRRLALFFVTAVVLAWFGFNGVPNFLDAHWVATTAKMGAEPDVSTVGLGATPYLAAFATFINIHHYFMDHVIWRRENPDTRFLRD